MVPIHSCVEGEEMKTSNIQHPTSNIQWLCIRANLRRSEFDVRCSMFIGIFLLLFGSLTARSANTNTLLSTWLNAQTNIQTWSADFTQTRALKSLTQPLTATGHVWFAAPNRFRWELGSPAQTIALRVPTELLVIYPRLKRVEHFPLNGMQAGQWKDALALLEAGFP